MIATSFFLEWGRTTNYANLRIDEAGGGRQPVTNSYRISNLKCGTRYHFRVSAWSGAGFFPGKDRGFRTQDCAIKK